MSEPRDPALEAMITDALVAGRDATEELRTYGDWLQERGHVRGELVALQCAGADATALLETHAEELVGPIVAIERTAAAIGRVEQFVLDWRCGFLRGARIHDVGHLLNLQHEGLDQARAVRDLVASPAARFLEWLECALPWAHEDGVDRAMQDALREHGPYPTLRRLEFATEESNSFVMAGDLSHLSVTTPNLRELSIDAGTFSLGDALELPHLESLVIESTSLAAADVAAIAASRWPRLEKLVLAFGSRERGATADLAHVAALLDGVEAFPALVHLGLRNHEFGAELVPLLAASRLLPRLEVVDLADGILDDDGAVALVAHADRFAHLQELALANNFIATRAILRGFPVEITGLDDQRVFEPEYYDRRYVATAE